MGSWFGRKGRDERKAEKERQEEEVANQYDEMVTKALERLTRWAFPDGQVERKDYKTWYLWHTSDDGQKYVDVSVELTFRNGQADSFICDGSSGLHEAEINSELLGDALRRSITGDGG